MPTFEKKDVIIANTDQSYKGFFKIDSYNLKIRLFQGGWSKEFKRELFKRGESAATLLYDQERDCVVMIEQFRIGAIGEESPWLTEIVAGCIEKDLTAEETIRKEAMEEGGIEIKELFQIRRYFPSPGGSSEVIHLFCGLVDSEGAGGIYGLKTENENIMAKVLPFDEVLQMIEEGVIKDAASIIALQWLELKRLRAQLEQLKLAA